ncbi:MAG: hypothetical protein Aureis2KO_16760 [Aureisphaera sp.]
MFTPGNGRLDSSVITPVISTSWAFNIPSVKKHTTQSKIVFISNLIHVNGVKLAWVGDP